MNSNDKKMVCFKFGLNKMVGFEKISKIKAVLTLYQV